MAALLFIISNSLFYRSIHASLFVSLLSTVEQRSPQIHRQGKAIRLALQILACTMFILTVMLISIRQQIASTDLSLLLPLPLFVGLGILPVASPIFIVFLEIVGTSRILSAAHPFASRRHVDGDLLKPIIFLRYFFATFCSRLSVEAKLSTSFLRWFHCCKTLQQVLLKFSSGGDLLDIPPATGYLLEKLGVVNALALVDDELACEPYSTPQQLLIPSGQGLKLLDLCPNLGDDVEVESINTETSLSKTRKHQTGEKRTKSYSSNDLDSDDSDEEQEYQHTSASRRTLQAIRRRYRKKAISSPNRRGSTPQYCRYGAGLAEDNGVQFEDPQWWHHLPSLKCIGLACLLVGSKDDDDLSQSEKVEKSKRQKRENLDCAEENLAHHICEDHSRSQLLSLAQCIGFSTAPNSFGAQGDLSPFTKQRRLHVVSMSLR